jgi:iron complex transport system permease protein
MAVGVSLGSERLSLAEVWDGLTNPSHTSERVIVWDLRLPRVILAVLVGANLAVAGALLQGVTRNPLADPHLLGISAGSGVVGAILLVRGVDIALRRSGALDLGGRSTPSSTAWPGGRRVAHAYSGVAVSFLLISMTTAILASSRLFAQQSLNFVGGSLFARGWDDLQAVWPYAAVGLVLSLGASASLNIMALGEDAAAELGVRTGLVRAIAVVLAVVLSGAAVSVADSWASWG